MYKTKFSKEEMKRINKTPISELSDEDKVALIPEEQRDKYITMTYMTLGNSREELAASGRRFFKLGITFYGPHDFYLFDNQEINECVNSSGCGTTTNSGCTVNSVSGCGSNNVCIKGVSQDEAKELAEIISGLK